MTISANFPSIRPTLLLDFANTEVLDPRITFSRPTTGTYYDAKTSAVAEQNLVLQSQDFDNASWTKGNLIITANSTTAPDGTSTADTLDEGTATNYHNATNSITAQAGTYTLSVYAKNVSAQYIILTLTNAASTYCSAIYDVSGGTVANSAALGSGYSITSTSIASVGSGWYRCIMTCVIPSTAQFNVGLNNSTTISNFGLNSYTGTSRTAYLWGAQLEQRSSATAYTTTTTTAITNYIPVLQTAVANAARFDHNPTTRESLGLLIEEQRTNLLTYSSDFSNAVWTKTQSTITTAADVAPDGTQTAQMLVENTATAGHLINVSATVTLGISYTQSIYAKANGRPRLVMYEYSSTGAVVTFDLTTGTVVATGGGGTPSGTITSVGNGWYRCTMSWTTGSTTAGISYQLQTAGSSGVPSYAGNGYSGIFIWGAQLEAGAFATSYIPTVASQVTRSADSASMTGTNFSSWFNAGQGTLYGEFSSSSSNSTAVDINSGSTSNFIRLSQATNGYFRVFAAGSQIVSLTPTGGTWSTGAKEAASYAYNSYAAVVNGGTVSTASAILPYSLSQINIGSDSSGAYLNGRIKKFAYYSVSSTNAQLQGLTG